MRIHSPHWQSAPHKVEGEFPNTHRGPIHAEPTPLPVIGDTPGAGVAGGIALCFDAEASEISGEDRFAILVVNQAGDPLMRIGTYDDAVVVAVWRRLAAEAGLPMIVIQEDGVVTPMGDQLGRVKLGATRMRRRNGLLGGRRPRFLVRRKTGSLPLRPVVHRNEDMLTDGGV
ncbi:MAG: DUF6101 family protein [Methylobacterium frigidaeris]